MFLKVTHTQQIFLSVCVSLLTTSGSNPSSLAQSRVHIASSRYLISYLICISLAPAFQTLVDPTVEGREIVLEVRRLLSGEQHGDIFKREDGSCV